MTTFQAISSSSNGHNGSQDSLVRAYVMAMRRGQKPDRRPAIETRWTIPVGAVEHAYDRSGGDSVAVERAIAILSHRNAGFASLLQCEPVATQEPEPTGVPPLPDVLSVNEARANEASPTLDALIAYFKYWATRSYEGYHEAVALWVLSTIAARRVVLRWRNGIWPNMYILLVSKSGRHAKTEAAAYGARVVRECGLGFLLAPDEVTPQKLLSKMSGRAIPRNYSLKNAEEKEYFRQQMAFAAQKGWFYDEFGDFLQEVIKGKGHTSLFYRLLKQLYDNKPEFTYDTMSRGEERIDFPSLSIIGTTAPDSLAPVTGKDSSVWTDGAFARIAFIVPPANSVNLQSAPDGDAMVPTRIIAALQGWHERLGEPACRVIDEREQEDLLEQAYGPDTSKKKKDRPDYAIERGPLPQQDILWAGTGVREAHEAYYQALVQMGLDYNLDARLNSNYIRLPDMALKIAMLLASLENNGHMDMRHWARGQAITERWRVNLHTLMTQLPGSDTGSYGDLENAVIDVLTKKLPARSMTSARDISQKGSTLLRQAGSPKVRAILEELYAEGAVAREGVGRSALYGLKNEANSEPLQG